MKSKVFKKLVAVVTAATMAIGTMAALPDGYLSQFGMTVSAASDDSTYGNVIDYGEMSTGYGETWWKLNDEGTLFVGGEGRLGYGPLSNVWFQSDYDSSISPWYDDYYGTIKKVVVEEGITEIANWAFSGLMVLKTVDLPSTLTTIGARAFYNDIKLSTVNLSENTQTIMNEAFGNCSSCKLNYYSSNTDDVLSSGQCGENAFWKLDNSGTLTINGSGNMYDYELYQVSDDERAPWYSDRTQIKSINIGNQITAIGNAAFAGCTNITKLSIPQSVSYIGTDSLLNCTSLKELYVENKEVSLTFSNVGYQSSTVSHNDIALIGALTIYGYKGSKAETYATENSIPFIALDSSTNDADEATLLERIKQLSGHEPSSYIYIDMDNDGSKEMMASIANASKYNFDIWFCSSDGSICEKVHSTVEYCNDCCDIHSITYSNEAHVIINVYNELGNAEHTYVFALNNENICLLLDKKGYTSVIEDEKKLRVTTKGYNTDGFAEWTDVIYVYDNASQKYVEETEISDTVKISWYNGTALILEDECKVNTKPEFKGDAPTCYYNEYGLKREFLGWTTSDNSDYSITIPAAIQPVTQDTKYYAVFSNKEPTPIISDDEVYDIDYINQHMESAKKRDWDKMKAAMYLQDTFECPSLEASHAIWKTITIVDETVNLDYMGIYGEISANDYNLIMIDMFNSAEGYEKATSIIKESSYSGLVDWANLVKGCLTTALGDKIKPDENYNNAYNAFLKNPTYENMTTYIDASNALCKKNNMSPADVAVSQSLLESYKITDEVLSGLNTGISTFQDVVKNAETISAYCMYQHMSQEYLAILNDMYKEAEKLDSNSWEVADLKNAINFAKYYYSNPTDAAMMGIITNWAKNITQLFAGNLINDVIEDQTVHFIQFTGKYVSGSDKLPSGETVSSYLAAVQTGFKYGVKISDKLFDMNNRDNLYVKIKEYGVLSKVLSPVLNNRANALLSAKSIKEQYAAAKAYDKAYKMYMYIEGAAASNAAKYERTFESTIAIKTVLAIINPANIIYYNELDKNAAKHVENATILESYARTADSMFCHLSWADREDFVSILIDYSNKIKDHKVVIVSCPVEMRVYDSNHILVGTLSASKTEIKAGYEPYLFRINETDSSVAVVPSDYTIEIVGLDSGTMRVIGSYFNGDTMINTVSYNNILVDDNYIAVFEINEDTSTLSEENHTHSYSGSRKCDSTYHWHECSCGEKTDIAQHISNGGIVTVQPTSTTGVKTYSCSVCGYVMRTETIPATGVNGYPSYPTYPTYPTYTVTPSVFSEKLIGKSEIKGNTVTLKWDEVKNADKYTVYQYKNGKYVKVKTTADTSVTFKKLKNGETYKFLVRYTINGKLSPTTYSCKYTIKVYYKPIAKATAAQNSVKLTWKTVPRAKKYAIYKYVDGKAVKLTEVKGTSVKINKLSSNTKYKYIVRAYVDGKWTTMTKSDIITIKTKAE